MAFAEATLAQRQAVRNAAVALDKATTLAHDTGPLDTLGPDVDAAGAAAVAALSAAGASDGGTVVVVGNGAEVTVPITFTTAREAGATATVAATITVEDGVITAISIE